MQLHTSYHTCLFLTHQAANTFEHKTSHVRVLHVALGAVAALCCCMWPCGIVGAVLGFLAHRRAPQDARRAKKLSCTGFVLAIVGIVAGLVALAVSLSLGIVLSRTSKSSVRPTSTSSYSLESRATSISFHSKAQTLTI